MFRATIRGDLEAIPKLVKRNPDLVRCVHYYTQPLKFAVRARLRENHIHHPDVLRARQGVCGRGSPPWPIFRDTCDRVPISIAARRGPHDIVKLLLERGADPNAPETGRRPAAKPCSRPYFMVTRTPPRPDLSAGQANRREFHHLAIGKGE